MLLLLACLGGDVDGDGFKADLDCDDNNASRHPDAEEICDGIDNNCNGLVDEGGAEVLLDLDGDGYAGEVVLTACTQGTGAQPGDCNDGNPAAYPGAQERCNGMDDDCDGTVDEEPVDATLWYLDDDGDGWGDSDAQQLGCLGTSGLVATAGDCDDSNDAVHPGAEEHCDGEDEDCDGEVDDNAQDGTTWYADLDQDGYGGVVSTVACDAPSEHWLDDGGVDCNDGDPLTNPDADERCDLVDNDCDDTIDESDAIDASTWYLDDDGDGYGDADSPTTACWEPSGYVSSDADCDDSDEDTNPEAEEICKDGIDNDCDETVNDCTFTNSETQDADYWWWGESNDYLGTGLAVVDHDGDGTEDLAMGAVYAGSNNHGQVYMAYGAATMTDGDVTDRDSYTTSSSNYLGRTIANAGDVDGDGVDDMLTGASGTSGTYGRVYLVLGGNQASGAESIDDEITYQTSSFSYLGLSVGGAGDLDADGYDDMLMGGYYYNAQGYGRVWLVYGDASPSSTSVDSGVATFTGDQDWSYLGYRHSISGLGDLDGDGYDDAGMAAHRYSADSATTDDNGTVGVIYGSSTRWTGDTTFPEDLDAWVHGDEDDAFLHVTRRVGDVDGDGYDDLAVGAWGAHSERGEVYLFYGNSTAWSNEFEIADADAEFRGEELYDYLGHDLTGEDFDGDGANELVLGAPYSDVGASQGGSIYLVQGGGWSGTNKIEDVAMATLTGSDQDQQLGYTVEAGDVNGDGYPDLVGAGAYAQNSNGDWGAGGVWIWLGSGM